MSDILTTKFCVVDTETTGIDPVKDRVVDLAWVIGIPPSGAVITSSRRVNPGIPIPATASAIHHIIDADVADAQPLDKVGVDLAFEAQDSVMVAHNAAFDRAFLTAFPLPKRWLCTMRLARHLWPDAPSHSNQALRYWLKLPVPRDQPVHRAAGDAEVTMYLLLRELETWMTLFPDGNVADLLAFVERPCLLRTMPFGKHAGTPILGLPADYCQWALLNIRDMDQDLRYSLNHRLDSRKTP